MPGRTDSRPGQPSGPSAAEEGFIGQGAGRRRPGRPALGIPLDRIIEAVRRTGKVMAAARELGCSDAYVHVRFRRAGLTLRQVLGAPDSELCWLRKGHLMAEFAKVGDKVVNLDAVAYIEPDMPGSVRIYLRGPDTGGGGGLTHITVGKAEVADLLVRAGFGTKP